MARGQPSRGLVRARVPAHRPRARGVQRRLGPTSSARAGGSAPRGPRSTGARACRLIEQVVLNEEFARATAPMRADFFGDTLVGPTILQWGTEEQKREFIPKILDGTIAWCQGFSEPDAGSDLASLKTRADARRRRVGDPRPEGLDDPGAVRRLHLPAGPHRPRCAQARGDLLPPRPHEAARGRSAAHPADRRLVGVQRGLLRPGRAVPGRMWSAARTTGGRWP